MSDNCGTNICVIVGDHSADLHASKIFRKLKTIAPELTVWGAGGDAMKDSGVELIAHLSDYTVIGIVEGLRVLPVLKKLREKLLQEIEARKPSLVLLIDFSGFNLHLAKTIKHKFPNLPIYYFISPQVWGSRPWRMNTIKATIDKMLVIFPFEESLYNSKGISSRFVGHPLTTSEYTPLVLPAEEFFAKHGLDPKKPLITIMPGSRRTEIRRHMPVVIQAINWLAELKPDVQFALSIGSDDLQSRIKDSINRSPAGKLMGSRLVLIKACENRDAMRACKLVWAKSGTTALEVTLEGKPMLIFYRADWLSYFLFLLFKRVRRVAWPNLLAGKELVPELFQLDCRAEKLVRYTIDLFEVPGLEREISSELLALRAQLGEGNFVENCAQELLAKTRS